MPRPDLLPRYRSSRDVARQQLGKRYSETIAPHLARILELGGDPIEAAHTLIEGLRWPDIGYMRAAAIELVEAGAKELNATH